MLKNLLATLALIMVVCLGTNAQTYSDAAVERYISKFKDLAISEQVRTGVPAAITLAQGIYETGSGTSILAIEAHNHFGIKCKKDWTGETILHDDDASQECFRKYKTDAESYTDHSNFLKNNRRYAFLFDIPVESYKDWAVGLRRAGYATNPAYSTKLITLIEKYNLQSYTEQASAISLAKRKQEQAQQEAALQQKAQEVASKKAQQQKKEREEAYNNRVRATLDTTSASANQSEQTYMGLRGFYAKKGTYLLEESIARGIKYTRLLELNDLDDEALPADMFIFVERKYKKHPTKKSYVVAEGDDMVLIAQRTAMQLKPLLQMNLLKINDTPEVGQRIFLQDVVSRPPRIKGDTRPVLRVQGPAVVTDTKPQATMQNNATAPEVAQQVQVPESVSVLELADIQPNNNEQTIDENNQAQVNNTDEVRSNKAAAQAELELEEFQRQQAEMANQIVQQRMVSEAKVDIEIPKPVERAAQPEKVDVPITNAVAKVEASRPEVTEQANDVVPAAVIPTNPPTQPTRPARKSPSNYNEAGVSKELRALKKVMDEVVYAAMPLPKPKVVDAPKPKPTSTPAASTSTPKPSTNTTAKPSTTSSSTASNKPATTTTAKPATTSSSTATNKPATTTTKATTTATAATKPASSTVTPAASVAVKKSSTTTTSTTSTTTTTVKSESTKQATSTTKQKSTTDQSTTSKVATPKATTSKTPANGATAKPAAQKVTTAAGTAKKEATSNKPAPKAKSK